MCIHIIGRDTGQEQDGWAGALEEPEGKTCSFLSLPVVPFPQRQARAGGRETSKRKLVQTEAMGMPVGEASRAGR